MKVNTINYIDYKRNKNIKPGSKQYSPTSNSDYLHQNATNMTR
jgi:hypothetical protein